MSRNYNRTQAAGALAVRVKGWIIGADNIGDEYRWGDFVSEWRDGQFAAYRVDASQLRTVWQMAQDLVEREYC